MTEKLQEGHGGFIRGGEKKEELHYIGSRKRGKKKEEEARGKILKRTTMKEEISGSNVRQKGGNNLREGRVWGGKAQERGGKNKIAPKIL